MNKCALLTMDNTEGFEIYDHYLYQPLEKAGWDYKTLSWCQQEYSWDDFDVVILRSTWDYQQNKNEFIKILTQIDKSKARLENNLDIIKWNIDKIYLQTLEKSNCQIVPTMWFNTFNADIIDDSFIAFNTDKLVIKPRISANANNTFILEKKTYKKLFLSLLSDFNNTNFMVQPFMPRIIDEGEYSLFYFGGQYSHTVNKLPKSGDFRVQEEHGGKLTKTQPDRELLAAANQLNDYFNRSLLYARYDFVRGTSGGFYLMEAELIEPSLYFNLDSSSADKFVNALNNKYK